MQYGFVFPQYEIEEDPLVIRDFVQAAEDLGYDYMMIYDHVLGADPDRPNWRGPYTDEHTFHEPFVLFGYLAGWTQTLEFMTGILILPQRQTALVAKQAAQVDLMTGGRLRLGVGVGWNWVEYDGLGQDFSKRGKRLDEQVEILRALWTQPLVTYAGEFHHIERAGIKPLPVQRPIPLWFGGGAEPALRRMARVGDGWATYTMPLDKAQAEIPRIRDYVAEAGRNPDDFGIDVRMNFNLHQRDAWGPFVQSWQDLHATHICANTLGSGLTKADEHLDYLKQFAAEIGI